MTFYSEPVDRICRKYSSAVGQRALDTTRWYVLNTKESVGGQILTSRYLIG